MGTDNLPGKITIVSENKLICHQITSATNAVEDLRNEKPKYVKIFSYPEWLRRTNLHEGKRIVGENYGERKRLAQSINNVDDDEDTRVKIMKLHKKWSGREDLSNLASKFKVPPHAIGNWVSSPNLNCTQTDSEIHLDPETRRPVIFHDKFYRFENSARAQGGPDKYCIPLPQGSFFHYKGLAGQEVEIARKYHQPDLNWRKGIGKSTTGCPYNNIVENAADSQWLWRVVIDHLCDELFTEMPASRR